MTEKKPKFSEVDLEFIQPEITKLMRGLSINEKRIVLRACINKQKEIDNARENQKSRKESQDGGERTEVFRKSRCKDGQEDGVPKKGDEKEMKLKICKAALQAAALAVTTTGCQFLPEIAKDAESVLTDDCITVKVDRDAFQQKSTSVHLEIDVQSGDAAK